jgi:hypothetical protein
MNASLLRWFRLYLGVAEVLAFVGLLLPAPVASARDLLSSRTNAFKPGS